MWRIKDDASRALWKAEMLRLQKTVVTVNNGFGLQVVHHRFGYTIVGRSPDIDNFVIAFASGHQTRLEKRLKQRTYRY